MEDDNENVYGKVEKKIIFKDTTKNHADLKVQLKYHNLNISKFFRAIVKGFLEKDEVLMEFVDNLKNKGKTRNVAQRKKIAQVEKETKQVEQKFGISEEQVENIFDILEQEHPEL